MSKLKMLLTLMILSVFLQACETVPIRLEPMPNYEKEYQSCNDEIEILRVNADHILSLKTMIRKLWVNIISANLRNITVIDLRMEEEKDN